MTKSQNTKNEQQKDLCITSEQLTKQLATESLPEYTEFYVRKKDGSTDTQTWLNRRHSSAVEWWNTFNITEVLAPVPSYEEWKALIDLYKEADVIIKKSDKENAQFKAYCHTLAQKLLQVKPELRKWLETNFKEYL